MGAARDVTGGSATLPQFLYVTAVTRTRDTVSPLPATEQWLPAAGGKRRETVRDGEEKRKRRRREWTRQIFRRDKGVPNWIRAGAGHEYGMDPALNCFSVPPRQFKVSLKQVGFININVQLSLHSEIHLFDAVNSLGFFPFLLERLLISLSYVIWIASEICLDHDCSGVTLHSNHWRISITRRRLHGVVFIKSSCSLSSRLLYTTPIKYVSTTYQLTVSGLDL